MVAFDVDLPSYHGPLDLLLYLIRREELDIESIELARITKQYAQFVNILAELDLENISEFIDVISQLIEYKAEQILPRNPNEQDDADQIPQDATGEHLIDRLIQYKRFRDLACSLDEQSRLWQLRYGRLVANPPRKRTAASEIPIARIEVWDLVSAFGRILKSKYTPPVQEIRYDDTPIHVYMQRIHQRLASGQRVELHEFFEPGMHKSALVATFLATLELTRYHGVRATQGVGLPEDDGSEVANSAPIDSASDFQGPLWLERGPDFPEELVVHEVDFGDSQIAESSGMPFRLR